MGPTSATVTPEINPIPHLRAFFSPVITQQEIFKVVKWEILYKVADMKSKGEMLVLETLTGAIVKPP